MLLFDIGANIGKWAIANCRDAKVIAVEASPTTFEQMKITTSRYPNVTPLNYAVSNSSSNTVTFYECTATHVLSTLNKEWLTAPHSRFGSMANNIKETTVPAITLDALIARYGVPDLLKIDVEGAEHIVLRTLTQKVPMLCFEWAAEWNVEAAECLRLLTDMGFSRFHIQNEDYYLYRPSDFPMTADDVIAAFRKMELKKDWGMIWAV
jgi:FkbM family methyltransferase